MAEIEVGVRLPVSSPASGTRGIATVAGWVQALAFHSQWVSDHVLLPPPAAVDSWYPYAPDHRSRDPAGGIWPDPLLTLAWAVAAAALRCLADGRVNPACSSGRKAP